jgi:hypothetical protein
LARWFDWSKRVVIINLPVSVSVLSVRLGESY